MNDVMEDLLRWLRNPCAETASDVVVLAMQEIRRLRDDPNRSQCELGSMFAKAGRLMKEVERLTLTDAEREAIKFSADQFAIAILREQEREGVPSLSDSILYENTITALAILRDLLARLDNKQEDT